MGKELVDGNYKAAIRDADDRVLSAGEVRIYTTQLRGVFWPEDPIQEDLLLGKAASVQTSTGHVLPILKIGRCNSSFAPVRYELDFVSIQEP